MDVLLLLGGLAFFLYGMNVLSGGLRKVAGGSLERSLKKITDNRWMAMLLGFVSYGLSVYCYVYAQRSRGAARTSAYYAIAPFVGVGISFLMFR